MLNGRARACCFTAAPAPISHRSYLTPAIQVAPPRGAGSSSPMLCQSVHDTDAISNPRCHNHRQCQICAKDIATSSSPLHPLERIFVAAIDTLVSSTQMFWSMERTPSSHDVARLPWLRVRTQISTGKDPDGLKPGISRFSQFGCQPGIGSRRMNAQSGSTMNFIYCGYIEYGSFRQLQSYAPT